MEFYDAVDARRTVRDFKSRQVDLDTIKRILSAGLRAPSNDHMRSWEFVVLTDDEMIEKVLLKIPKKFSHEEIEGIIKSWRLDDECQREMYRDALPKQYEMLSKPGCLVLPLFRQSADPS